MSMFRVRMCRASCSKAAALSASNAKYMLIYICFASILGFFRALNRWPRKRSPGLRRFLSVSVRFVSSLNLSPVNWVVRKVEGT